MRTCFILFALFLINVFTPLMANDKGDEKPNILFIEVDDLNYEYLGINGGVNKTPNVDALAQSGVFFKNAVAQGMMCGPSRNSLITGLYPHNLGFYQNGQMNALPEGIWTLPQGLKKSGYYTAWIGKCHIRPGGKNKTKAMQDKIGFDFVRQTAGRAVLCSQVKKNKIHKNDWYISYLDSIGKLDVFKKCEDPSPLEEDEYLDGFFTQTALNFLQDYNEQEPFFLWVNYSVPHGPYDVNEKYHTYRKEDMPGGTSVKNYVEPAGLVKKTKTVNDENIIREHQAGLCANVSFMDRQVGRLIKKLKELGLYDNTVIVFFSDQGVMMGDHHRFHKGTLYRQITNPALIVAWPEEMKKGLVIDAPVELTDLVKTSLELANAPESELQKCSYSYNLLPALFKGKSPERKVAIGEIEGYVMATDGKYRLIKGKDATLLFDDENDPKNLVDIAKNYPDIVKKLSEEIENWFEKTGAPLPPKTY
ncbi:MAG: sulfatase-like hydrolase/transferase [Chlorobi bacterium]|nr:sulfatase-like hydrolase/transferase [Chlorobiota bacterium]